MKSYPLVSLIFINYNGEKYIEKCLTSLFRTKYPKEKMEVIMVDNSSTDKSIELVRKKFPQVKIVKGPNVGYGAGANRGVKQAKGEFIGVLNIDLEFTKDWLFLIIDLFLTSPQLGIAAPILIPFKSKNTPEEINFPCISPLGFPYSHKLRYTSDPMSAAHVQGAVMIIRKKVFELIDGFDTLLFLYFEDLDICLRCRIAGYDVMLVPGSMVRHKESGLIDPVFENTEKIVMGIKNNTIVILKNYSMLYLIIYFPSYIFIKICDILTDIIHYEHLLWAKAKIKGLFQAFVLLPRILTERKKVQQKRVNTDKVIFSLNYPSPFFELAGMKIFKLRSKEE